LVFPASSVVSVVPEIAATSWQMFSLFVIDSALLADLVLSFDVSSC
jgi:hypothetical protein